MWNQEVEPSWQELVAEVLMGVEEWRLQHPEATFTEIEEAVDRGWAKTRARLLQDLSPGQCC